MNLGSKYLYQGHFNVLCSLRERKNMEKCLSLRAITIILIYNINIEEIALISFDLNLI